MLSKLLIALACLTGLAGAVHLRGYAHSPIEPIIDGVLSDLLGDVPVTPEERELLDFARSGRQHDPVPLEKLTGPWSSTTLTQTTSTMRDGQIHSTSKTFIDGRLVNSYQTAGNIWTRHLPGPQIPTPAEILDLTGLTQPSMHTAAVRTEHEPTEIEDSSLLPAESTEAAEEALTEQQEGAHGAPTEQQQQRERQRELQQRQQVPEESVPEAPDTAVQRRLENPQQDAAAAGVPSSGNDSAASAPRAEIRRRLR